MLRLIVMDESGKLLVDTPWDAYELVGVARQALTYQKNNPGRQVMLTLGLGFGSVNRWELAVVKEKELDVGGG